MRCTNCGTNNPTSRACPGCGTPAPASAFPGPAPSLAPNGGQAADWRHGGLSQPTAPGPLVGHVATSTADAAPGGSEVFGEVVCIEHSAAEHPDFDWCRFFSRLVWFAVFVLLPLAALHIVLTHLGPLSLLLAVFGLWMLVKFLMPQNLWAFIHMASMLNPFGHRSEATIPVRHLRVRTPEGWQVMVRMKGRPLRGSLVQDDEATFMGVWRDGVMFSKRAYVHRTRAWVEMEGAYTWAGLAVSLIVMATLAYYLHLAVRNVTEQLPATMNL